MEERINKELGKIRKTETTEIAINIDNYGDHMGVTIREFVTSDRYTGFTRAGTKIPAKEFQNFKNVINSITEEDLKNE